MKLLNLNDTLLESYIRNKLKIFTSHIKQKLKLHLLHFIYFIGSAASYLSPSPSRSLHPDQEYKCFCLTFTSHTS